MLRSEDITFPIVESNRIRTVPNKGTTEKDTKLWD